MLADNDFYQFTMSQWAKKYYPDTIVKYAFNCRSKINLLDRIDLNALNYDFDQLMCNRDLRSIAELVGTEKPERKFIFENEYLAELCLAEMPSIEARNHGGKFSLEYEGPWWLAMLLETPILAIVSEHWYRLFESKNNKLELQARLDEKIAWLKKHPYIKFFEFGTRRRHSQDWQSNVIQQLVTELPFGQLLGTSNPWQAQRFGLPPRGTMAHQMFMVDMALKLAVGLGAQSSLWDLMQSWEDMYLEHWDSHLLILLTDTFGTDWLLRNIDQQRFANWHGLRQDSGDPIEWGYKVINWARKHKIDLKEKMLCFSDGLDLKAMDEIYAEFASEADIAFGWGTNLTNDGLDDPISMVIKPIECHQSKNPAFQNWLPCVKLSDNKAKHNGSQQVIEYYKGIMNYSTDFDKGCVY